MTIPLTGAQGLFTRLGKIGGLWTASNLFRGTGILYCTTSGTTTTQTVTTYRTHGFAVGDTVVVAGATGASAVINGTYTIATVPSTTTFTYTSPSFTGAGTGLITIQKTGGVGTYNVGAYYDNIFKQFTTTDLNLVNTLYSGRDSFRSVFSGNQQTLAALASSIVVTMANDDAPQPDTTLTTALKYLISQMTGVASVTKPAVSTTVTPAGANVGNGTLVVSTLSSTGLQLDYALTETVTFTATSDAQTGATAGQESFTATSPVAEPDETNWDWPLGSGINLGFTTIDWTLSNSGGNALQNSNFATFTTANNPDNWTIATGLAGTQVFQAGSAYRGSVAVLFRGDNTTQTALTQAFNTAPTTTVGAGGTSFILQPNTVYQVFLVDKVSVVPAAGVLQIALTNTSGTVINDAQGTPNSFNVTLSGETTSFAVHTATFRTPAVLPTATPLKLQAKLTTALSTGTDVIFQLGLAPATQLYAGGPFASLFRGSTDWISAASGGTADNIALAVANTYSSQWALFLEPLFGLRSLGLAIPSSGSPTIADSLINS